MKEKENMKVSLFFAWYDFWVGLFYDQKKKILYICPLPCVVIKIEKKIKIIILGGAGSQHILPLRASSPSSVKVQRQLFFPASRHDQGVWNHQVL